MVAPNLAPADDLHAALANLAPSPVVRGPRCSVAVILEEIAPDAREALEAAMARPGVTSAQIARTLTAFGHPVKATTVARHRRAGSPTGCLCTPAGDQG